MCLYMQNYLWKDTKTWQYLFALSREPGLGQGGL